MGVIRNGVILLTMMGLAAQSQTPSVPCPGTPSGSHSWQEELRCTKILKVEAASRFFNADALVRELLKSKDFQDLDYQIVRHTGDQGGSRGKIAGPRPGQLLLRVTRKRFTSRFTVALVDPASERIYVSEESSSLGGSIEPDLAKSIIKWVLEANGRSPKSPAKSAKS